MRDHHVSAASCCGQVILALLCACGQMSGGDVVFCFFLAVRRSPPGGRVPAQPILVELVDRGAGQGLGNCDGTHLQRLWRSGFERGVPSQGREFDTAWG
eukprot:scaffold32306_cov34-Phaeocystis_antarctica.AAC.1